jgi:hypothetical protein
VKDEGKPIEARLTFMRETGTVETGVFNTVKEAKNWVRRRLRQLDAQGVATSREYVKREVFERLPIDGGAQ